MNVFLREIRANLKLFAIWALVIAFFLFVGTVKYTGVETGGTEMIEGLVEAFPRIVLAMFGMADLDIMTFEGFFACLEFYIAIMVMVLAVQLGRNAVSRELVDGTYEFLFVRPCSRTRILAAKLVAGIVLLACACALNFVIAEAAYATLELDADMTSAMGAGTLWIGLIGLLFLAVGACSSAVARTPELGSRIGMCAVLGTYAFSVAYDVLGEEAWGLRFLTPLKYFLPMDMVEGTFDPLFLAVLLLLAAGCLALAFIAFDRRDLAER